MKSRRVPLAELRQADESERSALLGELVTATRSAPNGEVKDLDAKIRAYEQRYEMSSAQLRDRVAQGGQRETLDVCNWLMLLELRDRLAQRSARSR